MVDKRFLLQLLDYNAWANDGYLAKLKELPAEEVTKPRPSLMNNMLINMNHLLVIDKVWLAHMRGEKHEFEKLQTVMHENLDDLVEAKKESDAEVRTYVEGLSNEELAEDIDYELIGGNTGTLPRYLIITHLAMHGGFHRGFAADMSGQIPTVPAGQDIPVWERALREKGLRVENLCKSA